MSLVSTNKIALLSDRAQMLAKTRTFFARREVMEVDVPMLATTGPVDPFIDLVTATCCGKRSYLHSSPEYGMKRLLAQGIGDCYQLGHVFRDHESGEKHNPEFTMIEWYRVGFTLEELIEETIALIFLFLGEQIIEQMSYEEAFLRYAGYFPETIEERDRVFGFEVEPHLQHLTVLTDYPPEQAMLAQTHLKEGEVVAKRVEIFFRGVELGNGYHELANSVELRRRLMMANEKRLQLNKERYPIDHHFIEAQIPDCCGIAVGFDRLMALRHKTELKHVLPISWREL